MTLSVEQDIGQSFAGIEAVEGVHVLRDEGVYTVYTIIDDEDEAAISRIYSHERSVIRRFPELHFDFNVIARRGRPLGAVATLVPPRVAKMISPGHCVLRACALPYNENADGIAF